MESSKRRWRPGARRSLHVDASTIRERHHSIDGQPESPDLECEAGPSSHKAAELDLGEVFFTYLEPLLDQTILLWVQKHVSPIHIASTQPAPLNVRSGSLSPVSTSSSQLGFDFGNFTDSLESPAMMGKQSPDIRVASLNLSSNNFAFAKPSPPSHTSSSRSLSTQSSAQSLSIAPPTSSSAFEMLQTRNMAPRPGAFLSVERDTAPNANTGGRELSSISPTAFSIANSKPPSPLQPSVPASSPSVKKYVPPHLRASQASTGSGSPVTPGATALAGCASSPSPLPSGVSSPSIYLQTPSPDSSQQRAALPSPTSSEVCIFRALTPQSVSSPSLGVPGSPSAQQTEVTHPKPATATILSQLAEARSHQRPPEQAPAAVSQNKSTPCTSDTSHASRCSNTSSPTKSNSTGLRDRPFSVQHIVKSLPHPGFAVAGPIELPTKATSTSRRR
jgi:hypothetical protein